MTDATQNTGEEKSEMPAPARGLSLDSLSEYATKMEPYMEKLIDVYMKASPYIEIGKGYFNTGWAKVKPYYNQYWRPEFVEVFVGLTLLFFGGMYAMTIACYMAIQISGWDTIKRSWIVLKNNYYEGVEAFKNDKDAQKYFDKDGDGSVSALEIGAAFKLLFTGTAEQKKGVLLNLRCIAVAVDPQEIMNGLGGIWATAIAVIATLRSTFAKDIALGVSIGEMVSRTIAKYAKPIIASRVSDDMQKWADFGIDAVCRFFGITLALMLMRVVSSFHAAVKGGQILARHILAFLNNKQMYTAKQAENINLEATTLFMAVQYGLAAFGWYWQISSGFTINSYILRLLLLPFSICEFILTWLAAY